MDRAPTARGPTLQGERQYRAFNDWKCYFECIFPRTAAQYHANKPPSTEISSRSPAMVESFIIDMASTERSLRSLLGMLEDTLPGAGGSARWIHSFLQNFKSREATDEYLSGLLRDGLIKPAPSALCYLYGTFNVAYLANLALHYAFRPVVHHASESLIASLRCLSFAIVLGPRRTTS